MTIQLDPSQDIDLNLRWEVTALGREVLRLNLRWETTEMGREVLRDSAPTMHGYVDGPKTSCGLPIEAGDPELSRDIDPVDCWACLFALRPQGDPADYCDGGCPENDDGEHIYSLGVYGVQCAACCLYLAQVA